MVPQFNNRRSGYSIINALLVSRNSSENRRGLEKERVALCRSLTEGCGSSLIRDLDRPKRRQIAIHKQRLDVVALDSGVSLKEDPQKQVLREELVGSHNVNPGAFPARIRIELQALQRVLGGKLPRKLVARRSSPQHEIRIEVAAEPEARFDRLVLPGVVPEIEAALAIAKIFLEALELLRPQEGRADSVAELRSERLIHFPTPNETGLSPVNVVVRVVRYLLKGAAPDPAYFSNL